MTLFPAAQAAAGADLSPCRRYRYRLWRSWGDGPRLVVIGLNPSTADETVDDPTIRRCIGFARRFGLDGLEMLNLYAWRETDPRELASVEDPVGPDNDRTLARVVAEGGPGVRVIAAWGALHRRHDWRIDAVRSLLGVQLEALELAKAGQPKHPLYLRADVEPVPWPAGGAA